MLSADSAVGVEIININDIKPLEIFIMEKDSKKFYVFNTGNLNVS
jgi:hypothetical protein